MERKVQSLFSAGSLLLLAVLFIALTMLVGSLFRGARLDLTENQLYTLSDGSRNILKSLPEPVTLRFYFSEQASRDLPQIRSYAQRVDDLLREFAGQAGSQLNLVRIDPKPFSEQEDEAAQYGLQPVPVNTAGDSMYFGIVGTNSLDGLQIMPFVNPQKEEFLEYDLAKMVQGLGQPQRPRVGLLTSLEMGPGFDSATRQSREPWVIYEQLTQLFDLETVDPTADSLPDDLAVLVVVHPKNLSKALSYAIDQFVLNGGRLVAFVDPLAGLDTSGADPNNPMAALGADHSSSMPELLNAWGVSLDTSQVVGDLQYALQVGMGQGQRPVRHLGILGVPGEALNQDDVVSADLESINLASAGYFKQNSDSNLAMEVLLGSSDNANLLDAAAMKFLPDPGQLLQGFTPSGESYPLAIRLTGESNSAYTDNLPEGVDPAMHLAASDGPVNIILFADTDLLADRYWVQKQAFFGQSITSAFADNGTLVVNAVDNMLGNSDLISIRARATSNRPFSRVEDLRRSAEQQFRATEERLQQELAETESNLTELQAARQDDNLSVMTPEQQAELQRFTDQRLQIRRDLRQVRRDLDKDIEALGTRLKIINIVLLPLTVAVLALVFGVSRRRKHLREQQS